MSSKGPLSDSNVNQPKTPKTSQMDLGASPPSPVLARPSTDIPDYDLMLKSTLTGMPGDKTIWIQDKVLDNKLAYSVKDREGKVVEEKLDLEKAKLDKDIANKIKLTQDWINLNKKIILEAIRAQSKARLFKTAQEIANAQTEKDQAEVTKELKKRLASINKKIQNPRSEDVASNLEGMRHLANMSMEGLAVKMAVDEIIWILKTLAFVQYRMDKATYTNLSSENRALTYDISKGADKNKPLYAFKVVGEKIELDKAKPLEVVKGKIKGPRPVDSSGNEYSDSLIVMANGYLPPPSVLGSWKKELASYVQKQIEAVIDPQERLIEAAFYKAKKSKSKGEESEEDAVRNRLTAKNLAARPKPTPGGGK